MIPEGSTALELFQLLKGAFSKQDQANYEYKLSWRQDFEADWSHSQHGWKLQLEVMLDAGGFGQSYFLDLLRMETGKSEKDAIDLSIAKLIDMNVNSSQSAGIYSAQNRQLTTEVDKLKATLTQKSEASATQEKELLSKFVTVLNSKVEKFNAVKEENVLLKQQLEQARKRASPVRVKKEHKRRKKRARVVDKSDDEEEEDNDDEEERAAPKMGRRESSSMMSISNNSSAVSPAPRKFRNKKKKRAERNEDIIDVSTPAVKQRKKNDKGKEEEVEFADEEDESPSVPTYKGSPKEQEVDANDLFGEISGGDDFDFADLQ